MAPVVLEYETKYVPIYTTIAHLVAAVYLTYTVSLSLYRTYSAIRPSSDTRERKHKRHLLVPIFGGLALLALGSDVYHKLSYLTLSYKVWAHERGVVVPPSFFATTTNGSDRAPLYLSRWLTDTPIYVDAAEIVSEKARRYWWGNQRALATVAWSMLLAIEGRRRKIPYLWAYMALAQLVNLSFAQNLFYVALLLAPAPVEYGIWSERSRIKRAFNWAFPPKPQNWFPKPWIFTTVLTVNYIVQYMFSFMAGAPAFSNFAILSRVLTFAPVVIPRIIPQSWGTIHRHPHDAYPTYTRLFRKVAVSSALLFAKATLTGLWYNLPDSHKHRHSIHIPFDTVKRSNWERTTSAAGKILGSMSDHPIVSLVGWDVIISVVSLGIWAAVRAMKVEDILVSSVPYYKTDNTTSPEAAVKALVEDGKQEQLDDQPYTLRRRGLRTRAGIPDVSSSKEADDESPAPKKRGRPRKVKADLEPEHEQEPLEPELPDDETYVPPPEVEANVTEGDRLQAEDEWETAALAWGIAVLGGLGAASAGVFGGECIAR